MNAEYLIYLKGGHVIVADGCSFSRDQRVEEVPATNVAALPREDCTREKTPQDGRIYWSTISGDFGEVNADDVYDILGASSLPSISSMRTPMPLEDYLITNRTDSFVNAKVVKEDGQEVFGRKREELMRINRRGLAEISPESVAKSRSGEGLCPGEPIDFSVTLIELLDGHLLGTITNLSKEPWRPQIEVEVRVKGHFVGKFEVEDRNLLAPGGNTSMDSVVGSRFLKALEQLKDAEAGVRLCYRKVKTAVKGPTAESPSAMHPSQ